MSRAAPHPVIWLCQLAGERQKALSDAKRAVELSPEYAKAHFRLGQALRHNGEAAAAAAAMARVLELEPGDSAAAVALMELREALRKMGLKAGGLSSAGASGAAPSLSGAFASGTVVPSAETAAKAATETFAARPPAGIEENFATANPKVAKGEVLIGETDFHRVAPAATGFLNKADEVKKAHAAKQPPPKPKTKADIEYPGIVFPPGFGPDAPDWDPTYTPIMDMK